MTTPAVTTPKKKYTKGQLAEKLWPQLRCCDVETFRSWLALAPDRYESPNSLFHKFCGDCTVAYQDEMTAAGRCISDEPIQEVDPLTPEVYADIVRLRSQGMLTRDIAETLNVSLRTVARALERAKKRKAAGV